MKIPIRLFSQVMIILVFILLFTVTACQLKQNEKYEGKEIPEKEILKQETLIELSGYPLPTSYQVTEMLKLAEAPYILSISNSPKKVNNYFSQTGKALNLGVYGADLCYASTYLMTQETLLFLEAARQLRDELTISTPHHANCYNRVKNNLSNGDSLITIISDSFYDTYMFLTGNGRDKIAILVMAGSWIEGIYITTQIAITAGNNKQFMEIIMEQSSSLDKLLELIGPVQEEGDIEYIRSQLTDLQQVYSRVQESPGEKELMQITDLVYSLRSSIVD